MVHSPQVHQGRGRGHRGHPLATWQQLAALVDGSHARFGEKLCSNRGRTRWFDCLVMERLWHRMMGEPGVLPRELALPWLSPAARCNGTCALPCPEPECTSRSRRRESQDSAVVVLRAEKAIINRGFVNGARSQWSGRASRY